MELIIIMNSIELGFSYQYFIHDSFHGQVQRYEGGSTIYGPYTANAYIQQYKKLADMLSNVRFVICNFVQFSDNNTFSFRVSTLFRQFTLKTTSSTCTVSYQGFSLTVLLWGPLSEM